MRSTHPQSQRDWGQSHDAVYGIDHDRFARLITDLVQRLEACGWLATRGHDPSDIDVTMPSGHTVGFAIGDIRTRLCGAFAPDGTPLEGPEVSAILDAYQPVSIRDVDSDSLFVAAIQTRITQTLDRLAEIFRPRDSPSPTDVVSRIDAPWVVIVKYQPDNEANDGLPAATVHFTGESAHEDAAGVLAEWLDGREEFVSAERSEDEPAESWFARLVDMWDRSGDADFYVQVVQAGFAGAGIVGAKDRAAAMLATYRMAMGDSEGREPTEDMLRDALTDLRHWCDAVGADLYQALDESHGHYLRERAAGGDAP